MRKRLKRVAAVLMAVITALSTLTVGINAFAATETVVQIDMPRGGDPNPTGWGHPDLNLMNGWEMKETDTVTVKAMGDYDGNACYCIEPGVALYTGDSLSKEAEGFWDNYPSSLNKTIDPDTIKIFLGRIMQYGYTGTVSVDWKSNNSGADKYAKYYATQLLIWEVIVGERDENFDKVNAKDKGKDNVKQAIKSNHPLRTEIFEHYDTIVSKVKSHTQVPSFMAKSKSKADTIELTWNGSEYTATLTDANKVIGDFTYSASGLSFETSGNKLIITAKEAPSSDVTITAKKGTKRKGVITWTDQKIGPSGKIQDMVTYGAEVSDPVSAYINVKVSYGSCKIVKTSEDNIVSNIKFNIKGHGIDKDVVTNSKGEIQIDNLVPGSYTVTEYPIDRYKTPASKTVTVLAGQVVPVSFSNILKKGNIKVQKNSEDNIVSGFTFNVTGSNGASYSITSNSSGVATLNDLPVYDSNNNKISYTVKETSVPIRYVTPDNKTITLEADKTSTVTINNILKKFRVNVTKVDVEKTHPQGDAKLSGAVYGIYDGEKLVDTYTTDANGKFTTKYYVCGDNWSIREITPSEGYNLDTTKYHVGAEAKNYTVELNTTSNTVKEQVIKGNIAIIKHSDDGSTKIETPEKGAEFQIYLKSSGSYAKADADERDTMVCDEDGFASCKLLPYGVYTVHQTKGWEGREKIADFDVFIKSEGMTYKFLINNANFYSYLKVVKEDAETGKAIAYEGAGFEIYDSEGHRINMKFTYPQVTSIHTFYTNSEGYLITPEQLPYGNYTLVEVQAPYGYVLDSTPIKFSIKQENASTDTGVMVVKTSAKDVPQKGVIEITKTGEVFASVEHDSTIYTPIFKEENLKGAVFEIYAAEDITTLDGSLRYQQGEKVDEITTGNDGIAKSKELYLGKYTVIEKTAPNTFVNANEQYDVELTYAGQDVKLAKTGFSVFNERQRVTTALAKTMQEDCLFALGQNNEIFNVEFGLYAAEDMTATNGDVIPTDALISLVHCDKEGKITFDCDLPIGYKFYVKEVATDEHYILDDTKYEISTEYQGQDVQVITININDGENILNKLIYGKVKGFKYDRETNEGIKDATFGLFSVNTTEYTEDTALKVTKTDENGVFEFDNIPYGEFIICEITPASGYLENKDIYHVHIDHNEQIINLNVVNDRIPELKTTATVDGEKEICATETFTLTDTVEYKHLIPNKEYTIKGILMDKNTNKPFMVDGKEVTSEVTFTPTEPCGTIDVLFTFDSKFIKAETNIVVFESIYKDNQELAVHADINDEDQTVTVKIPNIKTKAQINGKKKVVAQKDITIKDTVTYTNLTVGKEYVIKGILMDKKTGKPFKVNGKQITAEVKFTPENSNGTVDIEFTFDGSGIKKTTDVVVFESLYREGVEIATHADLKDKGQTVTIEAPKPKTPKTGDERNYGVLLGSIGVAFAGLVSAVILKIKSKKEEDEE